MHTTKFTHIYGLFDPRVPEHIRYVGWATNVQRRLYMHIWYAKNKVKRYVCNWIRTLLDDGIKPSVRILEENALWKDREQFWIAKLLREGHHLTNLTDGGEGCLGWKPPAEYIAAMSADRTGRPGGMKGKKHSAEARAKMSAAKKGKKLTSEHKAALSAARKGVPLRLSPDQRAARSDRMRNNKFGLGNQANLGRKHTDEEKMKIGAASKGNQYALGKHWKLSEETRRKQSEAALQRSEEHKRRISEGLKRAKTPCA